MNAWVLQGDCAERLRDMPDECIDAVVTDPPYGLAKEPDALEMLRHSGTTLCAAVLEGHRAVGIELTAEYLPIIEGRLAHARRQVA